MAVSLGLILLIMAPLALLGTSLLWRGFKTPRLGTEPRCRRCEYNLTGLESDRCPECGSDLRAAESVVRGVRRRRLALIIPGALLLALSVLPLLPAAGKIQWYRLAPTSWVIADLDSTKPGAFSKAWSELKRRDSAGKLSASDQRKLIARGLKEQGLPAGTAVHAELIEYVGQALVDGLLSEAEVQQFVDQIANLELAARKRVVLGDRVPFWIANAARCPCIGDLWVRLEIVEASIDGSPTQGAGGSSGGCGVGDPGGSGSSVVCDLPGLHTLSLTARVALYQGGKWEPSSDMLHGDWQVTLQDEFEVLPEEPPDLVRRIEDPSLAQTLRKNIVLQDVSFGQRYFQMTVHTDSIPVAIAFDVWALTPDGEEHVESVARSAGPGSHSIHVGQSMPRDPFGETCTIILRGSADAAKGTVDMYEYWDGELVYENMPIRRSEE